MATIRNLYIDQGSDYNIIVTIQSKTGSPMSLVGYTPYSQMRKAYGSTFSHTLDVSVHDALLGKIKFSVSADESNLIQPGRWLYDIEIHNPTTFHHKRVIEGLIVLTSQCTQIPAQIQE